MVTLLATRVKMADLALSMRKPFKDLGQAR